MHRMLLLMPPPDPLVPELFDLITVVSTRVASGEIDFAWAAYVYNSYERDLVRDRPQGTPRRAMPEVEVSEVERYVQFYALQKRPDGETALAESARPAGEPEGSNRLHLEEIEAPAARQKGATSPAKTK